MKNNLKYINHICFDTVGNLCSLRKHQVTLFDGADVLFTDEFKKVNVYCEHGCGRSAN